MRHSSTDSEDDGTAGQDRIYNTTVRIIQSSTISFVDMASASEAEGFIESEKRRGRTRTTPNSAKFGKQKEENVIEVKANGFQCYLITDEGEVTSYVMVTLQFGCFEEQGVDINYHIGGCCSSCAGNIEGAVDEDDIS